MQHLAYLVIRKQDDGSEVHRVGLTDLSERRVERVMLGLLRKLRDDMYIDDSEVDAARATRQPLPMDGNDYHHFGEC